MIELLFYGKVALVSAQVVACFVGAVAIMAARHVEHNYFAGVVGWLWAGGMMAVGMGTLSSWPDALATASLIEAAVCGASAGLAIYSGGSIFKVCRLCRRLCAG